MALTDLDALRLRIADRPAFHREEIEQLAADNLYFRLGYGNILSSPAAMVYKNGTLLTETTDYSIDASAGVLTLVAAPALGDQLVVEYTGTVFTDDELNYFLAQAAGGSVTLAAVNALLAWAADASKLARKETLSGGGGLGSISVTTDLKAQQLRLTAQALLAQYNAFEGAGVPVEMITETPWTEAMEDRMVVNRLIDSTS